MSKNRGVSLGSKKSAFLFYYLVVVFGRRFFVFGWLFDTAIDSDRFQRVLREKNAYEYLKGMRMGMEWEICSSENVLFTVVK